MGRGVAFNFFWPSEFSFVTYYSVNNFWKTIQSQPPPPWGESAGNPWKYHQYKFTGAFGVGHFLPKQSHCLKIASNPRRAPAKNQSAPPPVVGSTATKEIGNGNGRQWYAWKISSWLPPLLRAKKNTFPHGGGKLGQGKQGSIRYFIALIERNLVSNGRFEIPQKWNKI